MGLGGPRRGHFTRPGTLSSRRGHPARTGTLPSNRGHPARVGTLPSNRGHPARTGTLPSNRGHPARTGTGILSPTASNAPARGDTHPAVQDVPGCEAVSPPGATRTRPYVPVCAERPCGLCRPRSRTYFSIEDCVLLQKVTARAQSFEGEVRPGRRTQSSMFQDGCAALSSRPIRAGRHDLVEVFAAGTGAHRPTDRAWREVPSGWDRLPVPGCSDIGFAPWLQDDASTQTPAPRPCASGPRSRARPTTNRPELGAVPSPTPPAPLTGPSAVG